MSKSPQAGLAKGLRHRQTEAERKLWAKLRSSQLDGVKFRRQEPIENYIVDFGSFDKGLIVEIDGGQHNNEQAMEQDKKRTKWLESQGFHIIRFWNNDVLLNTEGVLMAIQEALQ